MMDSVSNYILYLTNTITNATTIHPLLLLTTPPYIVILEDSNLITDSRYVYYITAENKAGTEQSTTKEIGQ